jgi:homoserine O-acetyltransferase
MGGKLTWEWITQFPEFMDRAVPMESSPRIGSHITLFLETQLEAIDLARKSGDVNNAGPLLAMIDALLVLTPDYHDRRTPSSMARQFVERAKSDIPLAVEDKECQLRAILAQDVSRRFDGSLEKAAAAVEARVLVVQALEDITVPPGTALHFAALLGAETLELENNCGHLAVFCEKERVVKAVRSFLD